MIKFPFTDFHEMNLDWILNKVKETEDNVTSAVQTAEDADTKADAAVTHAAIAMQQANGAVETANEASADAAEAVSTANQAYEELAFSHKFKMPHGNTVVNVDDPYYGFAVIIGDNDTVSSFWKLVRSDGVSGVQMIFPTTALPAGTVNVSANGGQFAFANAMNSTVHALLFDIAGTATL